MSKRLVDLYPVETAVFLKLGENWVAGVVVRHQFPAVWVQTMDGRMWFVTNGGKIRRVSN
jgi:hypothetical protein